MREDSFSLGTKGRIFEVFHNRRDLPSYWQSDLIVLREECHVLRREFIQIRHINVFLEAVSVASPCNKLLRKRFLKPVKIGLIPIGSHSCNVNYCKEELMWLVYREHTDGCTIMHARKPCEYRPPEFPHLSVNDLCAETRTVHKFLGCYCHGLTCLKFRDVTTIA